MAFVFNNSKDCLSDFMDFVKCFKTEFPII